MSQPSQNPTGILLVSLAKGSSLSTEITLEEYLRGVTAYNIADNALQVIFARRRVSPSALISDMLDMPEDAGLRTVELCTADLYMWCASTPSVKNDTEDSDGGWKHKEGGWETSAYDKRQLRAMAKDIYDRWGESFTANSKMRIINL